MIVGAGALRGIILHKLMEELLTELVEPELKGLERRAQTLMGQVAIEGAATPDPWELARTALRTFSLQELEPYLPKLLPEIPLYGARSDTVLVSARADAIAYEAGVPVGGIRLEERRLTNA